MDEAMLSAKALHDDTSNMNKIWSTLLVSCNESTVNTNSYKSELDKCVKYFMLSIKPIIITRDFGGWGVGGAGSGEGSLLTKKWLQAQIPAFAEIHWWVLEKDLNTTACLDHKKKKSICEINTCKLNIWKVLFKTSKINSDLEKQ